ncbi:TetR family transcriptional regulator [Paractinoplanes deccanensis]|uniref:TetR family transcriptional regulator n=1 Tax=Paractinoplanes deccanensis TaxID=113561 RepID=A0ABQ3YIF2_9ACTN|nr:TetR/AcrR family transcriptional regulator [Actinoplanes deccanensis]GID79784.1 TetR family transcriptional regulator [Actinoplanes deccanensis]
MTDSQNSEARRPGKRERLVSSAADLMHRRGVSATSLADVAHRADVPPGNVYYYFKTKDELVRAVLAAQTLQVTAMTEELGALPGPVERLKALTSRWDEMRDVVARYGCPFGSLASELDRRDDGLDRDAAGPMRRLLDWAAGQFRELGCEDPDDLATALLAGIQGGALLAATLREPHLMTAQVGRLHAWIDTVGTPAQR